MKALPQIVLASASPRRRELLENIGLVFTLDPSKDFVESTDPSLSPQEMAQKNAEGKAKEVAARHKNALIIGVDTIGVLDGEILEKPKDRQDAIRMIRLLQGREHQVISALCLIETESGAILTELESTTIEFLPLSEKEIIEYVNLGESEDKAAAYAAQGKASLFIKGIDGDFFNVVGLPMALLKKMFHKFDVDVLSIVK